MPTAMEIPLKLENFTKRYGTDTGAENISLELARGEVFGFLGPNGAGKTTTIRAIMNFISPTSGSITVLGQDSMENSVGIKSRVGYLAGDIALYEDMNGQQLLDYMYHLGRNWETAYVDRLKGMLDIDLNRPIKNLFKGNKQKIGLLQAFMHKPDLVLLDEPTSGLDPLMQQVFYDLVDEAKNDGRTIFISSHNLQEVQRLCDRAAFIRHGKLIGIESIGNGQELNFRRYIIRFKKAPKQAELEKIEGVSDVSLHKNEARVTVTGALSDFLKEISAYQVQDLGEEETSLEEVFMHYYEEDDV